MCGIHRLEQYRAQGIDTIGVLVWIGLAHAIGVSPCNH